MSLGETPIAGIDEKLWAGLEVSFATKFQFLASHSLCAASIAFQPEQEWTERADKCGTASLQGETPGKSKVPFTVTINLKKAAAGVASRAGPFFEAVTGSQTIVPATSVQYDLDSEAANTLQIGRQATDGFWEQINGAVVEQMTVNIDGGTPVSIEFSGTGAEYSWVTGASTDNAGYSGGASQVTLKSGDLGKVSVGALVAFGAEDNGGSGYSVTAIDTGTGDVTFTPVLAGAIPASETAFIPIYPAHDDAADEYSSIEANLNIDGVDVCHNKSTVTIETGRSLLEGEASPTPKRAGRAKRKITFSGEFYPLGENLGFRGRAWETAPAFTPTIILRIGEDTAGERFTITLPKVRLKVSEVSIPEAETATYTAEGMAWMNAASDDEMVILRD